MDSTLRNLRDTSVAFCTDRMAIAAIQAATMRDVSRFVKAFISSSSLKGSGCSIVYLSAVWPQYAKWRSHLGELNPRRGRCFQRLWWFCGCISYGFWVWGRYPKNEVLGNLETLTGAGFWMFFLRCLLSVKVWNGILDGVSRIWTLKTIYTKLFRGRQSKSSIIPTRDWNLNSFAYTI